MLNKKKKKRERFLISNQKEKILTDIKTYLVHIIGRNYQI